MEEDRHDVDWPALPLEAWESTCATLHLWTQVVGKIRLAHAPMVNHWWQVTLYVTCRGLTTSPIPCGARTFEVDFDFVDHRLVIRTSDGASEAFALQPSTVADFYDVVMRRLRALGIATHIWTMPSEIADAIPFDQDRQHKSYDAGYAHKFWRTLVQADRLLNAFRAGFIGKVSPVHFFWGSFDLAVTRFSGRPSSGVSKGAPNVAAWVMQEAYSHEVSSCGFWPGNGVFGRPAFYAYAYPEPAGFAEASPGTPAAFYDPELGQFLLPYDDVRLATSPDEMVMSFLQSTYRAAADNGRWDRVALERADRPSVNAHGTP
jgi:uncharacterized protein DUF5996